MKKINLLIILMISGFGTQATVRTVNNNGGAQFTDINSAVVAASVGDFIYISGSATAYNPPTTRKDNITFVGTGFNVQKQNAVKSTISSGVFSVGNNNTLYGLEILGQLGYLDGNPGLNIQRCYIQGNLTSNGTFTVNNMIISGCVINGLLFFGNKVNFLIASNNIFYGPNFFNSMQTPTSAVFDHNSFVNYQNSGNQIFYSSIPTGGITFSNNIFWNVNPNVVTSWTYTNNFSNLVSNLNTLGTGNINNTTFPFMQVGVLSNWSYAYDLRILPASLAHNGASDGSDIGAFGGTTPYRTDGEPPIPQIDQFNIIGTQFSPGSNMNIQFQSTTGN